jgi:RNA polymerase sigma-70 factor (ECF subfamily)
MSQLQDKKIVEGCLRNDRMSQKALYEKFKTQMYTLAYRITNNFEDANDVLQEGFVKVFNNLESFKGNSKLGTWVHTIIARTALNKIKNRIYFEDVENVADNSTIDWGASIDTEYLEQAIASLPDGYRTVFTLYEIEGFKHREIADMLSISENTSKTQLFKAKKMLQVKLQHHRP